MYYTVELDCLIVCLYILSYDQLQTSYSFFYFTCRIFQTKTKHGLMVVNLVVLYCRENIKENYPRNFAVYGFVIEKPDPEKHDFDPESFLSPRKAEESLDILPVLYD